MKAEINNENKAKFFALYWGQLIGLGLNDQLDLNKSKFKAQSAFAECIELKPLSSISDEDAIELAKYFKVTEADFWTDQFSKYRTGNHYDKDEDIKYNFDQVGRTICEMIEDCSFFSKRVWYKDESDIIIAADYLRSRGYALPWMGLSVEEMVEAGWIKLIVE